MHVEYISSEKYKRWETLLKSTENHLLKQLNITKYLDVIIGIITDYIGDIFIKYRTHLRHDTAIYTFETI